MRSIKTTVIAAVMACTVAAYGQSKIVYTVETGGNNHAAEWENLAAPTYTSGVTDGSTVVKAGVDDLNWAVRVSVGGYHEGIPGQGYMPYGAANLVFDLVVLDSAGQPVDMGAAPMACASAAPGQAGAVGCVPTDKGFYSTINDGDADGVRGANGAGARDTWANAAFAIAIYYGDTEPTQKRALIDDASDIDNPGPNFDYGWYPTANGRGGVDIDGSKPVNTSVSKPELKGKLVGFGAGYKNYNYASYRPGVGMFEVEMFGQRGFGAEVVDIENPAAAERPLFEGQICTKNMTPGTYYLKVIPSQNGNNILHGNIDWTSTSGNFGGFGSFAAKANQAIALPAQVNGLKFVVEANDDPQFPTQVVARNLFYNNSYYDKNNVAINADDIAAIDTNKSPLIVDGTPTAATFANWTGYSKGINGLIYDIEVGTNARDPQASDFAFATVGLNASGAPVAKTPLASSVTVLQTASPTQPKKVRVAFTFADGDIKKTWLQVTVGTGFGLAAQEVHYWGNAVGDTGQGNTATTINVSSFDELAIRANPKQPPFSPRALVTDPYDIDKNSSVNSFDQLIVRANPAASTFAVKVITK